MDTNSILIALSTAFIGGIIGTYLGARFLQIKDEKKMKRIRATAIKALNILRNIQSSHIEMWKMSLTLHYP